MVSGRGTVCDVGTDHAYLAAELIMSGKCGRVIASDINEGPLEAARSTVEKYGVADKVDLVLSNGLENVDLEGVSDIVIAGMGGETIAGIISGIDVSRYDLENFRFVLQPMSKEELLRKEIYNLQLKITSEKIVRDGGKEYVVMCAEYNADFCYLTETEAVRGTHGDAEYLGKLAAKYRKAAVQMKSGGHHAEAVHFDSLAEKLEEGTGKYKIKEIYRYLDELYPFDTQEKWDNSGWLVQSERTKCTKAVLTLDITSDVISRASCMGAELIISHHPVIFEPLKKIERFSPVFELVQRDISAICLHTNLDIAEGGTNGVILEKLRKSCELACDPEPFEDCGGGRYLGWIVTLKESVRYGKFAEILKKIFGCEYIRAAKNGDFLLSRIAICSGSGGSMADLAMEKKCDALVTGDVKHDVWINANNRSFAIFDCGHFHTENLVLPELRRVLEERFPLLDVEIAEDSTDPCVYL